MRYYVLAQNNGIYKMGDMVNEFVYHMLNSPVPCCYIDAESYNVAENVYCDFAEYPETVGIRMHSMGKIWHVMLDYNDVLCFAECE